MLSTNLLKLDNLILGGRDDNQRRLFANDSKYIWSWWSWKTYINILIYKIDFIMAWYFERAIQDAYRWLSDNYQADDCIFLFGYSRGAFQVRVLSAMIDKVGLIYQGNESRGSIAYELYTDPESDKITITQAGSGQKMSKAERFKSVYSHENVKVHFVGVWETVASVGITRRKDMFPGAIDGMTHVCYFRQALALDERRVMFLPEYAFGDAASKWEDNNRSESEVKPGEESHTKEVWFAGTHMDIGGVNTKYVGMDLGKPPLRWMAFEAEALGLRMRPLDHKLSFEGQIVIKESLTRWWWLLELLPFKRPTYMMKKDEPTTYKPHLGSGRIIHPGQKIHNSILSADDNYVQ